MPDNEFKETSQLNITNCPREFHEQLKARAKARNISLRDYCLTLLQKGYAQDQIGWFKEEFDRCDWDPNEIDQLFNSAL